MTEANGDHNESSNLPKPFEFNKTSTSTSTSTKGEESPLMSTVFYDNFLNKINNNFIEEDNPEIISNPPTTQSFPSFNDTDVQGNMLMLKRMDEELKDLDSWKKTRNAHNEKRKVVIQTADNGISEPQNTAKDDHDQKWDNEIEANKLLNRCAFNNAEELEKITQKVKETLAFAKLDTKEEVTSSPPDEGVLYANELGLRMMEVCRTDRKRLLGDANNQVMDELEAELHQMESNGIANTLNQNIQNYEIERLFNKIDKSHTYR